MSDIAQKIADARMTAEVVAATIGTESGRIFGASFHPELVDAWRAAREREIQALVDDAESPGGLAEQSRVATRRVADLQDELSAFGDEVQRLQQHDDLTARILKLKGDPGDEQSIAGLTTLLDELNRTPGEIEALETSLQTSFRAVHHALMTIRDLQMDAYQQPPSSSPEASSRMGSA